MKKIRISVIIIFLLSTFNVYSVERFEGGVDAIYNFQSSGIGIGLKGDAVFSEKLIVAALIDYYPPISLYHELYIGVEVIVPVLTIKESWVVYPLAVVYYQMIFNHPIFSSDQSKFGNMTSEGGAG